MKPSILFAALLIALSNCIVDAASNGRERSTFGNHDDSIYHRVSRQSQATSEAEQLDRCFNHGGFTHGRLLFIWYDDDGSIDPVKYLRKLLVDDLDLPKLVFSIERVRVQGNQMLFDMSNSLNANRVFRNYCNLYARIAEYRSQGYDDPALTYEIIKTDERFFR
ncbi:uncharacterized protein [Drosophila virilis]|uniref:Uncharacterized protein n=1 Tax=Drosophila virilis TaxID=7244 RepID=B4LUS1_DROVI|nr:uncharacterized protein LOC6628892 isoform X2 [Drosophila virilis]EDW64248.1 uncharacterized protein Dvir_GJ17362 [Drosophila virilis]